MWTDVTGDLEEQLRASVLATLSKFSELTGFSSEILHQLRVICFDRKAAFQEYSKAIYPQLEWAAGYYTGILRKKMILCAPFGLSVIT